MVTLMLNSFILLRRLKNVEKTEKIQALIFFFSLSMCMFYWTFFSSLILHRQECDKRFKLFNALAFWYGAFKINEEEEQQKLISLAFDFFSVMPKHESEQFVKWRGVSLVFFYKNSHCLLLFFNFLARIFHLSVFLFGLLSISWDAF